MPPMLYADPDDGYEPDDPKHSGWFELNLGARLQRHHEHQEDQ